MLVDSHCHLDRLDLKPFEGDLGGALKAAEAMGVEHFLCVSIDLHTYPSMLDLVKSYDQVSVSVGVHPNEPNQEPDLAEKLVALSKNPRVVAIGETGLDYFRSEGDLSLQQEQLRQHISAARISSKPLIIHSRDAKEDTLTILSEEKAADVGGVMHCFTEDWDMAKRAMDLNFYISFSGVVTFKNAKILKEVARRMPLDRILVETDSPYLAPVPNRGKINQPAYVRYVAEHIAELRGESLDVIAEATTDNFFKLFSNAQINTAA